MCDFFDDWMIIWWGYVKDHYLMEIGTMSLWFLHFYFFPTHSFISIAHNQFILLRQKVIPSQYDEFNKDTEENLPKDNWFCLTKIVHHHIDFETFNHFAECWARYSISSCHTIGNCIADLNETFLIFLCYFIIKTKRIRT